ncbi:MAG: glycosyltransferase [Bacteroidetes bacterium]|nr:glycosyltransferase [Bacteroidota bacterium]
MALLSILLPYLYADDALFKAIDSILKQTYTDWELILIANGNPEEYVRCKRHTADDRFIHLMENQRGIAYALNSGLIAARGKYIGRMDADDVSLPNRFQLQVAFLENHPHVAAVSCRTLFDSPKQAEGYKQFVAWQNEIISPEQHFIYRFQESAIAHPSICFRKILIQNHGAYSTLPWPEDYELWLRWMEAGELIQKLLIVGLIWKDSPGRLSRTNPSYSDEAFFRLKAKYLIPLTTGKKVLICGSSDQAKQRWDWMEQEGLKMDAWTDIAPKNKMGAPFISANEISWSEEWIVLSLIAQIGTREKVAAYFIEKGYQPCVDYFSCA